jgi:hypothetical protein
MRRAETTTRAPSNCALYEGATPVFADVDPDTLLVDSESVAASMTPRTKAIIAVDFGGQPCDYARLRELAGPASVTVIADACHALGGRVGSQAVGTLADLSTFSFHPVKHAATGEGGAITTDDDALAQRMRVFRNHGITSDPRTREARGAWRYDMVDLGMNYRLSDIQCALGITQLERLDSNVARRQEIAARYDAVFAGDDAILPLARRDGVSHAYHMAAGQPEDALGQQVREGVPYLPRLARVDQTAREAVDEIILTLGRFQQHRPAIRTRVRLVKRDDEWSINEPREEDSLWYPFRVCRKGLRGRESPLPTALYDGGAFVFLSKSVPS